MKSRILLFFSLFLLLNIAAKAQVITLIECQEMAAKNYPAIARYSIIEQSTNYTLANANRAYLPQLSLEAKATYQSDVISVPIEVPGFDIPVPDKDQYNVALQANQIIWDGGKVAAKKHLAKAGAEIEIKSLESEIYTLKERVNNLYFGVLLLQEQLKVQTVLEEELQRNLEKVSSYIEYGVAQLGDLNAVKIGILKAGQQRVQMESAQKAYVQMLSVLTGQELSKETEFSKPSVLNENSLTTINRPELDVFIAQKATVDAQARDLKSGVMPIIGAFAQGGYGKPGLNLFQTKFDTYFIGGLQISWNVGNLYTLRNSNKINDLKKLDIDAYRETFIYNLNMQISEQQNEIDKFRKTMKDDDEIIQLQQEIKDAADVKVENGTMTVTDMLKELTELNIAKQNKLLNEIQHLQSIYNLKNTTN